MPFKHLFEDESVSQIGVKEQVTPSPNRSSEHEDAPDSSYHGP